VVTVNYRLGALGYLTLPSLDEEQGNSGNYGFLDQIATLRWVHDNIAAFGGDPTRVAIAGQSAGAGSACAMLASPAAKAVHRGDHAEQPQLPHLAQGQKPER
jgi:para-nitrobenzyl esterase